MLFRLGFWCFYKMADLKKQNVCIKFCFIWVIHATETPEMLKVSSQEHGMETTQVFEWVFKYIGQYLSDFNRNRIYMCTDGWIEQF